MSSSVAPTITCRTMLTAAATSATSERGPERVELDRAVGERVRGQQDRRVGDEHEQEAGDQRERKPQRGDQRREDALRTPRPRRPRRAPQKPSIEAPGMIAAAARSDSAATSQATIRRAGRSFGTSGSRRAARRRSPGPRWASSSPPRPRSRSTRSGGGGGRAGPRRTPSAAPASPASSPRAAPSARRP